MERYHEEAESKSVWIATGSWESEASGVNGDGERESDSAVDDEDIGEGRGRMADETLDAIGRQAVVLIPRMAFFGSRTPIPISVISPGGFRGPSYVRQSLRFDSAII